MKRKSLKLIMVSLICLGLVTVPARLIQSFAQNPAPIKPTRPIALT